MIDLSAFRNGMDALARAFNRALTPEVLDVFGGVLSRALTTEQWGTAVRRALEVESFFPPPAVLLRYGLAGADAPPEARAGKVYGEIVDAFESGRGLTPRTVRGRFGEAAMHAFQAAGGAPSFAWCEPRNEPFRRKDFISAFAKVAQADPLLALPPAPENEAPVLEAGPTAPALAPPIERRAEACDLSGKAACSGCRARARRAVAREQTVATPTRPAPIRTEAAFDERVAFLKAQAAAQAAAQVGEQRP